MLYVYTSCKTGSEGAVPVTIDLELSECTRIFWAEARDTASRFRSQHTMSSQENSVTRYRTRSNSKMEKSEAGNSILLGEAYSICW